MRVESNIFLRSVTVKNYVFMENDVGYESEFYYMIFKTSDLKVKDRSSTYRTLT